MKDRKIGTKFTSEGKRYVVTEGDEMYDCVNCDFIFAEEQCVQYRCTKSHRKDETNVYFKLCKAK